MADDAAMPKIPQAAIRAAAEAIMTAQNANDDEPERWEARHLARAALEAAAPILAEAVAQKITAHMEAHGPKSGLPQMRWHRHLSTAARVAAGAFDTREEQIRMVAEAIDRGDFIACDIPKVPDA